MSDVILCMTQDYTGCLYYALCEICLGDVVRDEEAKSILILFLVYRPYLTGILGMMYILCSIYFDIYIVSV